MPAGVAAAVVAAVVGVLLLGGDDGDPGTEDQEGPSSTAGDATTTSAPDDGTPDSTPDDGSAAFTFPATPFVHLTSAELLDDGAIAVGFETNFAMSGADSFAGPNRHVHLFWDVDDRARSGDVAAQAGTNGDPEPCNCWFAYGGPPPAVDQSLLHVDLRPEGATAVCALVATADDDPSGGHAIADVDGDGVPDPGSGDCIDVTALFAGTPGDSVSN